MAFARKHWSRISAAIFLATLAVAGGSRLYGSMTASDCCASGASCCKPGAPCCNHAAKQTAQR